MNFIEYQTDQELGPKLLQTVLNLGWVEFLQKTGRVYLCQNPTPELWQKIKDRVIETISGKIFSNNFGAIGIAKTLAKERLLQSFILPPMLNMQDDEFVIGTGTSRLIAELMCGTDPADIVFVVYCHDNTGNLNLFRSCTEIKSTQHFETHFSLQKIDYKIGIDTSAVGNGFEFRNSIVRHSMYDKFGESSSFWQEIGHDFTQFLNRSKSFNDRIQIHVHCIEQQQHLIPKSNEHYLISLIFEPVDEWQFSYAKMLGSYRGVDELKPTTHITVWVFDIAEPLIIELLLLWTEAKCSAYYTKNKKIVLFDTTQITSIQEIGDFVK